MSINALGRLGRCDDLFVRDPGAHECGRNSLRLRLHRGRKRGVRGNLLAVAAFDARGMVDVFSPATLNERWPSGDAHVVAKLAVVELHHQALSNIAFEVERQQELVIEVLHSNAQLRVNIAGIVLVLDKPHMDQFPLEFERRDAGLFQLPICRHCGASGIGAGIPALPDVVTHSTASCFNGGGQRIGFSKKAADDGRIENEGFHLVFETLTCCKHYTNIEQ